MRIVDMKEPSQHVVVCACVCVCVCGVWCVRMYMVTRVCTCRYTTRYTHTHMTPPPRPLHIAPTTACTHTQAAKLNSCKTELEASSGFASSLSMLNKYVSTASMLGKGSDCGMLLDHCFKAPSDSLNIFFRCLPRYNITKQYVGKHMRFISGLL